MEKPADHDRRSALSIMNRSRTSAARHVELTDIAYISGSPDSTRRTMTEREQQRLVNHHLAVIRHAEEVTGNVAQTCRYFGITRQTFYVWLRRYQEMGLEGLRDKSRRPHHSPNATSAEVVGKIIYLRQNYHFGPGKIAMYLHRYHDITLSKSGVWRILQRLELNRLPAAQKHKTHQKRWKRYEKPQPGHAIQMDVKFITLLVAPGNASTSSPPSTSAPDCES
jgi:transposase